MIMITLPVERLHEVLIYDSATGELRWKYRHEVSATWNTRFANKTAGTDRGDGYIKVVVDYKQLMAHRVIWAIVTGCWPSQEIDHINGNPADNRISNLRSASRAENSRNMGAKKNSKLGIKGVYFNSKDRRFFAQIRTDVGRVHLGSFLSATEAEQAYQAAAENCHRQFSHHLCTQPVNLAVLRNREVL